jgi:hypothetical protein
MLACEGPEDMYVRGELDIVVHGQHLQHGLVPKVMGRKSTSA